MKSTQSCSETSYFAPFLSDAPCQCCQGKQNFAGLLFAVRPPKCSQAYAPDFDCRFYSGSLVICALIQSLLDDASIRGDVRYLLPRQQLHLDMLHSFTTQTICRCTPRISLWKLMLMAKSYYGGISRGPSMTTV